MTQQYYTVTEAAEILRTTPNTIRVKIREGKIPVHPLEGNPLIPKEFIETWDVESQETFTERKLRQELASTQEELKEVKTTLRQILRIGMEVDL